MDITFQKHSGNPEEFFQILPLDWQEALAVVWNKAKASSEIYVIENEGEIIAGGIVFKQYTQDMVLFKKEAQKLLAANSYYIGYLWVKETHRGKDLGTFWLNAIKGTYPKTNFWLTIEEENLQRFYTKNGFKGVQEVANKKTKEWLLKFTC